jgi:hypothetical protein
MRELALIDNSTAHDMLVDEEIGVVDGLDLRVLVFVYIFEKVQLSEEFFVFELDFLQFKHDSLFGLDLTLVEHDACILVKLFEFHHCLLGRALLLLVVNEYALVDLLNALDFTLYLPLHDLHVPFKLFVHFIHRYHFMVLVVELGKYAIGAQ